MNLPPIIELAYLGVADAGVANRERIVLRPTQRINLAQCAVLLAWRTPDGTVIPYPDQLYWFGGPTVDPPSWIFLYTGAGSYKESTTIGGGQKAYVHHWGKTTTIFHVPEIVPVIVRFDAVLTSELRTGSSDLPFLFSDIDLSALQRVLGKGPSMP